MVRRMKIAANLCAAGIIGYRGRMATPPQPLYEKIWASHVVERRDDGTCLIYIDRHLVHEVTSPQAFEGLRVAGRRVRRPDLTLAVPDHNLPTTARVDAAGVPLPIADPESAQQLDALRRNTTEFGIDYIDATAVQQGIVHVVGPELGFTLPGSTLVTFLGGGHTAYLSDHGPCVDDPITRHLIDGSRPPGDVIY